MVRDEKYRKLIRSHCMKGKNVGKIRIGLGSPAPIKTSKKDAVRPERVDIGVCESPVVAVKSVFDDRFAMFSFPSRLDARMHDLLYRCSSPSIFDRFSSIDKM